MSLSYTAPPRLPLQGSRELSGGLIGTTPHPAVGRERVLPEVLFRNGARLRGEVFADDLENGRVRGPVVAVRPVASVDQAILAEEAEQVVEAVAIEGEILGDAAVDAAQHRR